MRDAWLVGAGFALGWLATKTWQDPGCRLGLVVFLVIKAYNRMRKPAARLAPETERILREYDYPGNVRELKNLIERAVILSSGAVIDPGCIVLSGPTRVGALTPPSGSTPGGSAAAPPATPGFFSTELDPGGQPPSLAELERRYIARLLVFTGGNRTQVARLLGVSYPTVAKKIADYGL